MEKQKPNPVLPNTESDEAEKIIKRDKKLFSILMIIMFIFAGITMLIGFIVGIVQQNAAAAILALISAATTVLVIIVVITVAHNISRQTAVIIKIAEKLLGENPLPNKEINKQNQDISSKDETKSLL